jgi:hypothetical protein
MFLTISTVTLAHWTQIADMLPSKMAPSAKRTKLTTRSRQINSALASSKAKSPIRASKKPRKATVEDLEVEEVNGPQNVSARNRTASPDPPAPTETTSNPEQRKKVSIRIDAASALSLTTCAPQKTGGVKRNNPIYLFYEAVPQNASGQLGDPGDKHYRCCHGNHKILTVTKLMKCNLNGSCILFDTT